ncbi:MAG: ATP-binding protein [Victivallales bacterium]|nr:ATP-binding protein [Victivallales bacterium]
MKYLKRTIDKQLKTYLDVFGAILIEGPKWCGKTTTAEQISKSVIKLQDPDMREEYLTAADVKPSLLLEGETPRLIDEWQDVPVIWDAVRTAVDKRSLPGQFILTGSNTIDRTKILHSGTGRIARLRMLPMSLWETQESNGKISLLELFDEPARDIDGILSEMSVEDLIYASCRGGWPASLNAVSRKSALLVARDYVNTVCSDDISRVDDNQRDSRLVSRILWSYARNVSTIAKKTSLLADITASGNLSCSQDTFDDYLNALAKLFVIHDIEGWCPAIRSKTVIRSSPKRCLIDPSIAVAALGLTPKILQEQLKTFGFIFEQLCIRDLKSYAAEKNGSLSYYRDRYGLEADGVLHLDDGRYALLEFKLGAREIEDGASHLLKLASLVKEYNKTEKQVPLREPDLLMVITGGKMAYTRPDGVKIIPLGCLKP